jgi:hypothetical protein
VRADGLLHRLEHDFVPGWIHVQTVAEIALKHKHTYRDAHKEAPPKDPLISNGFETYLLTIRIALLVGSLDRLFGRSFAWSFAHFRLFMCYQLLYLEFFSAKRFLVSAAVYLRTQTLLTYITHNIHLTHLPVG